MTKQLLDHIDVAASFLKTGCHHQKRHLQCATGRFHLVFQVFHAYPQNADSIALYSHLKVSYCHWKFRPLSNIRLCHNDNLFERSYPMAKRRKFTAKFKAEVVLEALRGESSQAELCRRYNLSENQVSTWKHQLLENVETFFESTNKPSSESAERIAQLEQLVGRLTLSLEIQKKASTLLD